MDSLLQVFRSQSGYGALHPIRPEGGAHDIPVTMHSGIEFFPIDTIYNPV